MVPIPKPIPSTLRAIQTAIEENQGDDWESVGVPAGEIGVACDRAVWLAFRRAAAPEKIDWRKRRIFERGDIEEDRLVDLMRLAGFTVTDQQERVRGAGGHLRGKTDGKITGLPESSQMHILECKSSKASDFRAMVKSGVQIANPKHYATMQFYMAKTGLDRAVYAMSCKDTEDLHIERVRLDIEAAIRAEARIERIIAMPEPPTRLCAKRDDFRGMFCRQAAVCWGEEMPRSHCRSCLHSTPLMDGNAGWDCARWQKPLGAEEQLAGCPAHLFIPAMVPGELVAVDEDAETIEYKMKDGTIWIDGAAH